MTINDKKKGEKYKVYCYNDEQVNSYFESSIMFILAMYLFLFHRHEDHMITVFFHSLSLINIISF